jgi:hypothetical protein
MLLLYPCYNVIPVVESVSRDSVMDAIFTKNVEFLINALLYHVFKGEALILLFLQQ